ncbi:MAG: ABC transporter ATP-binding protein [Planctomycetota bacterium]|jgi:ABC-2 type transport system ATP-binding protein
MNTLVKLDKITKDYGRLRALDAVSLSIGSGVTGLLGPNGAGKTTLIKVLLGLVRVSYGSGEVLGHELRRETRAIRARVGYMPEDDCYVGGLSGVEMLRFAARLSGLPSVEALRRAHEIMDFCGIEQERYRNVETYSAGMRQKLKFAQAIVHDPPFLILDEPTAGLDPEEREAMLDRIRVLSGRAGKAVLISTHILPDVQTVCDTVIILARGRVRIVERLEVLTRPASPAFHVRVFGEPDLLADRIRREGFEVHENSQGTLTLVDADEKAARRVWNWAREAGVGIRTFTAARNSLEQIFLEAVREDDRADS